jgi:hypothetical protein
MGETKHLIDSGTCITCTIVDVGGGGTVSVVRGKVWEDMFVLKCFLTSWYGSQCMSLWRGKIEAPMG